jgi:hypothetical protein
VSGRVKINLKRASKRPHRPFCGMCTKPRCVPPHELPIATSMNLTASNSKLHIPHIRIHLPQNKSTRLCSFGGIPVTRDFLSSLELGGYHPHFSHCICIVNGILKFQTTRCSNVLLQYVLSRRSFLQ